MYFIQYLYLLLYGHFSFPYYTKFLDNSFIHVGMRIKIGFLRGKVFCTLLYESQPEKVVGYSLHTKKYK